MRPGDLVGAIANEAGIDARAIGAVDIADRFSLVEVPDEAVDEIIGALRNTTIRGKKVVVRRDRGRTLGPWFSCCSPRTNPIFWPITADARHASSVGTGARSLARPPSCSVVAT
jgi:hypothetical protein